MLTDEQAAVLVKYYQTVQLTGDQKDRLIRAYWKANSEERREIARAYASVFANDAGFVQRLVAYHDIHRQQTLSSASGAHAESTVSASAGAIPTSPSSSPSTGPSPTGGGSPVFSCSGTLSSPSQAGVRLSHTQLLLRTAIQDHFPKLTGNGPFALSFGLVNTEKERREVVDLYSTQFQHPDPPELQRLVSLPQSFSTRTRRRIRGGLTWYLRCLTTNEIVCAVTIRAHHHQNHHFVEMPLFATAAGYKKNGFGRLLNTALAAWCRAAGFEFTMVSADVQAIPFWQHLGYTIMTKGERNRIAFFYEHECYKFKGAEPMIGYCSPRGRRERQGDVCAVSQGNGLVPHQEQIVGDTLKRMSRFVMVGQLDLPDP